MDFLVYAYTDKGSIREENEDTVFAGGRALNLGECKFSHSGPLVFGVCDGVGGANSGEIASMITAKNLCGVKVFNSRELKQKITDIHYSLRKYGEENPESLDLQTTLCMGVVNEKGECFCLNSGDSRLYFYHDRKARQVSVDHSYVQELVKKGMLLSSEVYTHPEKNMITSSIGMSLFEPIIDEHPVCSQIAEGDVVIVCSDGVSDYVWELEIEAAMSLNIPFCDKIRALAELALDRGSSDNISITAITPKI